MIETTVLTPKQQKIYDFIARKIDANGFPPTIRDICTAFEIKSPNGVMCHLKALERKGYITRKGKSARAIQLTSRPAVVSFGIPYKGLVAAGVPLPAIEQNGDRIDLNGMFAQSDHFALKVQGRSMIEAHIQDGDIVIIRNQESARNGDRVVAMVDGEVTLKIFQRKKDDIHLIPANGDMAPIVIEPDRDIRVVGVLVGVVRQC